MLRGTVACRSPSGLSSLAPGTSSPHFLSSISLGFSGISFSSSGRSHLPTIPSDPKLQSPTPPAPFLMDMGVCPGARPVPSVPPFSSPATQGAVCCLGYFYPRSFLKERAAWSPSQSMGLCPCGKPPLMGKESGVLGCFFFLGPGFKPSIFVCSLLIYQGFSC